MVSRTLIFLPRAHLFWTIPSWETQRMWSPSFAPLQLLTLVVQVMAWMRLRRFALQLRKLYIRPSVFANLRPCHPLTLRPCPSQSAVPLYRLYITPSLFRALTVHPLLLYPWLPPHLPSMMDRAVHPPVPRLLLPAPCPGTNHSNSRTVRQASFTQTRSRRRRLWLHQSW